MARDVVWLASADPGVGRPPKHSLSDITLAAVTIADRDGLVAMTMRTVASELGTAASSLYRYVSSRDDLIDLMVDHVAGEYTLTPPTGDRLEQVVTLAAQGVEIHRRHPWLTDVRDTPVPGPNGLAFNDHVMSLLDQLPVSDGRKLTAFAVVNALVSAFSRAGAVSTSPERQESRAQYLAQVIADGRYPHLASLAVGAAAEPDDVFPDVIRGVLRGLLEH